jgi:hypothetical protein
MTSKTVEIRDVATFIPALAIRLDPATERDRYLLARAGYPREPQRQAEFIVLMRLAGGNGQATCDPYDWTNRTMHVAHQWLLEHFEEIESGAVVDVEYLLGLRPAPKLSEQDTAPP